MGCAGGKKKIREAEAVKNVLILYIKRKKGEKVGEQIQPLDKVNTCFFRSLRLMMMLEIALTP